MAMLFRLLAFALFIALALVTYRLWRQQKRTDPGLVRLLVAGTVVFALFLFHEIVRQFIPSGATAARSVQRQGQGRDAMERLGCGACHSVGGGVVVGPDLQAAARKYDRDTLRQFIEDPEKVYAARRRHPLNEGFTEMPSLGVDAKDAEAIAEYLDSVADGP